MIKFSRCQCGLIIFFFKILQLFSSRYWSSKFIPQMSFKFPTGYKYRALFSRRLEFSFFLFFLEKREKAMKRRLTSDLAQQLITGVFLLVQVTYKCRLFFCVHLFCKTFRILSPRKLMFVHPTSAYVRLTVST